MTDAVRSDKQALLRVIRDIPSCSLGGIWLGFIPGYPTFVSLSLPRSFRDILVPHGEYVHVPHIPSQETNQIYRLERADLIALLQRDGFGISFWNDYEYTGIGACKPSEQYAFVTLEVLNKALVEELKRVSVATSAFPI